MCENFFILTDKCEFVPDEELEKVLEFNMRACAYVYNKTLEFSINRTNLVKEFGIGTEFKVNRSYSQDTVKYLKDKKPFLKKEDSTCLQASNGLYVGIDVGITDFLTFSTGKVIAKPDLKRINGRIRYYQQKLVQQKQGGSN